MATSVTTHASGNRPFTASMALRYKFPSRIASVAYLSFRDSSILGNKSKARKPSSRHSSISRSRLSIESRYIPGMEATSVFWLSPSTINKGKIRLEACRRVSCTISRITADFRFLLGRCSMFRVALYCVGAPKTGHVGFDLGPSMHLFSVVQGEYRLCQTDFVRRKRQVVAQAQLFYFFTGRMPYTDNLLARIDQVVGKICFHITRAGKYEHISITFSHA